MLFGKLPKLSIKKNITSVLKKENNLNDIVENAKSIASRAQELIERELHHESPKEQTTILDFFSQDDITKIIIEMNLAKLALPKQLAILNEAAGRTIPRKEYKEYVAHIFQTIAQAQQIAEEEKAKETLDDAK